MSDAPIPRPAEGRRFGGSPRATYNPEKTEVLASQAPGGALPPRALPIPPARAAETASFELTKLLGRGGMGEVWEALQTSLGRRVAVKRVRRDLRAGSRETALFAQMFREEAFTTANLEHPNIVPVHDLATDETGQSFLAMKLVNGKPWDELLWDELQTLPVADFLARHVRILIDVAQAVAFAHSRGIVHRDLKPSQVMVGAFGEVLLMDWGLAIAVDHAPPEPHLPPPTDFAPHRSVASSPAGTFAFMAPEQTAETAVAVGPWTDVFLLGGTLYCVLTGELPYDGVTAERAFEQARLGEVVPPELRRPDRDVPAELSALCRKAMAKEPAERLPSAKAFVAGLEDYLSGVSKRHEAEALLREVRTKLSGDPDYRTLAECDVALARAEGLWPGSADVEPLRTETLSTYARTALSHGDLVLAQLHAERVPHPDVQRTLLSEAAARREAKRRNEKQRRLAIAGSGALLALLLAGGVKYSLDQRALSRKLAVERDRANTARSDAEELVGFMLGDLRDKLKPVGRLDILDDVGKKANAYFDRLPASDRGGSALARRATTLRQIGQVRLDQGDLPGAEQLFLQARSLSEELLSNEPESVDGKRSLAESRGAVGQILRLKGDLAGALVELSARETALAALLAARPADAALTRDLIQSRKDVAFLYRVRGEHGRALPPLLENRALLERLLEKEPGSPTWRLALAESYTSTAWLRRATGAFPEAAAEYAKTVSLMEGLVATDPRNSDFQLDLAAAHSHRTLVLQAQGRYDEALLAMKEHRRLVEALVALDPLNASWRSELATGHGVTSAILVAQGSLDAALSEAASGSRLLKEQAVNDPKNPALARELGISHLALGRIHFLKRDLKSAAEEIAAAGALLEPLLAASPKDSQNRRRVAQTKILDGRIREARGDGGAARKLWGEAVEILEPIAKGSADTMFTLPFAQALALLGRTDEARPIVDRMVKAGFGDPHDLRLFRERGVLR